MSCRVFFVEDEYMIRENIIRSSIWSADGYNLVGYASNGLDALNDIKSMGGNIDIIITDIKMPFMDGLELIENVTLLYPGVKAIILSGYDEFVYAQKGLRLGVSEYLLKPVKAQDLVSALNRVFLSSTSTHSSLELQQFLIRMCNSDIPSESIESALKTFNINLNSPYYTVATLEIVGSIPEEIRESFMNTALNYSLSHADCRTFFDSSGLLYFIQSGSGEGEVIDRAIENIALIENELKDIWSRCVIRGSVGIPVTSLTFLRSSLMSNKLISGLVSKSSDKLTVASENNLYYNNLDNMSSKTQDIKDILDYGSKEESAAFADSIVNLIKDPSKSMLFKQYIVLEILTTIIDFTKKLNLDSENIPLRMTDLVYMFDSTYDLEKFKQSLIDTINRIIECRQTFAIPNNNIIMAAKKYIDEHYQDPNLNLNTVATAVNVSSAYFTVLFKKYTGLTFIEYLTNIRIEEAKRLLSTTQKRTGEIAFTIGYNDQNYFSKLFKKHTGMSTREFRKNL